MRFTFLLLLSVFFLTGCSKKDSNSQCSFEVATPSPQWDTFKTTVDTGTPSEKINRFVSDNNLTVQVSSSGLVYSILEPGTGDHPSASSEVLVYYKGQQVNGDVFDQRTACVSKFGLDKLIPAWKEGIPLLKRGGRMIMLVKPALGYGPSGNSNAGIGPNSVLVFEIVLADF